MSTIESIGVALFLMAVVFACLLCLFLCINLFSSVLRTIENTITKSTPNQGS